MTSVRFSHSVESVSLHPHGLQHTRLPCPSPTPGGCSNSCPSSRDAIHHLILSRPLIFLPSVLPSVRVFSMESVLCIRWPKYWSFASASVLLMNIQDWFPLEWTGLLSLQSKTLKSLLQHYSSKTSILWCSAFFIVQLSHPYMTTGITLALTVT